MQHCTQLHDGHFAVQFTQAGHTTQIPEGDKCPFYAATVWGRQIYHVTFFPTSPITSQLNYTHAKPGSCGCLCDPIKRTPAQPSHTSCLDHPILSQNDETWNHRKLDLVYPDSTTSRTSQRWVFLSNTSLVHHRKQDVTRCVFSVNIYLKENVLATSTYKDFYGLQYCKEHAASSTNKPVYCLTAE